MSDLTDAQVMGSHVAQAVRRLNDGAVVSQTLEDIWRAAYACGVKAAQRPNPEYAFSRKDGPPGIVSGWRFSTAEVLGMRPGIRFVYGGVDVVRPNTDRNAVVLSDGVRMRLEDTGEQVRMPVSFWARVSVPGTEGGDGA